MSWHAWLTIAIIAAALAALIFDLVAPAVAVLGSAIVLMVFGVITPAQALAGFSNPAPLTVGALFVLARAVERTGALSPIVYATLGRGTGGRWTLTRLLVPAAAASAFLNNTPIVAMLAPQVSTWAERNGRSPSLYLMPLSFAVILGGVTTLIGTSTNLLVSGLLQAQGQAPIGMFELTRIGLPAALVGLGLIVVLAPLVLPERRPATRQLEGGTREFVVAMRVVPGGPLDGQAVEAGGLRHLQGVFLVQVERGGEVIAPVAPTTVLRGEDRLTFVGRADLVLDLQVTRGLESAERQHVAHFDTAQHTFFAAVVGAASPLVGRTLKEIGFRGNYQAAVVGIHRSGENVAAKLGEVELKLGDTLLLLSDAGFRDRWRDRNDFLLISPLGGTAPGVSRKAWLVGLIGLAIVVGAGTGQVPILQASLVGAVALVALGVLSPAEARGAVDLDVLLVIAGSFGLGEAILKTGLARDLAHGLVALTNGLGPRGVLLGLVLATVLLDEVVTNNASAALMFPIALAAATEIGANPRPFALAITVAASCSFLTPIGYQTNTMVYGPGGYRFGDYARLGAPLAAVVVAVIVFTRVAG